MSRRIGAAYEKISEEYSDILIAGKVNIDEEPQIAEAEKIEIIPTLVLYRDGKAIDSIVAPESKIMIENFINEAGKNMRIKICLYWKINCRCLNQMIENMQCLHV